MNKNNYLFQLLGAVILANYCQLPINAQVNPKIENPRVKYVNSTTAQQKATEVFLAEGKFTIIKFEDAQKKDDSSIEKISNVSISDPSRNVHSISRENDTGRQGKVVFIRQTEPIKFSGVTTSQVPNLVVLTVDRAGNEKAFVFNINNDNPDKFTEKVIISDPQKQPKIVPQPKITIQTIYGEANSEDIKLGLDTLVKSGKLPENDKLIFQINEYYALTINGTPSNAARKELDIPLSVLQKLAEIGQQEDTKQRLTVK